MDSAASENKLMMIIVIASARWWQPQTEAQERASSSAMKVGKETYRLVTPCKETHASLPLTLCLLVPDWQLSRYCRWPTRLRTSRLVGCWQVLWENLDTSSMGRKVRRLLTTLFALFLLISSFIALYHTQRLRQVRPIAGPCMHVSAGPPP